MFLCTYAVQKSSVELLKVQECDATKIQ